MNSRRNPKVELQGAIPRDGQTYGDVIVGIASSPSIHLVCDSKS